MYKRNHTYTDTDIRGCTDALSIVSGRPSEASDSTSWYHGLRV